MALPTDWAARFVAINAKSVAARRSFVASGVRTPPSAVCRSLAWNTCSTAMACNADAASPSEAYALLEMGGGFCTASTAGWCPGLGTSLLQGTGVQQRSPRRGESARNRGPPPIHVGEHGLRVRVDGADWGADHVFTSCSWTSGKKGTDVLASALRVDLKYHESSLLLTGSSGGFQVSSNSCTAFENPHDSSWRPEGSELPMLGLRSAQPSFSEAEMDMASSPSSWPKATNPSILEGGRKQSSGKESGMRRPLGSAARQDALPPPGEGGLTSGTLAAVSPTPNRPRTTSRRARSTRTGRSAQCPQSDSSSAASAWARPRQATQEMLIQRFDRVPRRSYTLKPSRFKVK